MGTSNDVVDIAAAIIDPPVTGRADEVWVAGGTIKTTPGPPVPTSLGNMVASTKNIIGDGTSKGLFEPNALAVFRQFWFVGPTGQMGVNLAGGMATLAASQIPPLSPGDYYEVPLCPGVGVSRGAMTCILPSDTTAIAVEWELV